MTGSLREWPGNKWQLRVYVGRNEGGKPVHKVKYLAPDAKGRRVAKRAAGDALADFVKQVRGNAPEVTTDATLSQLLERWLAHIERERTVLTIRDYRGKIEGRINPELGKVKISNLSAQRLDATYRSWLSDGLSPATIRKQHAIIAAACHQAERWGILARSPTDRATLPRAEANERGRMTLDDVGAVLRGRDVEDGDVFGVAVTLGALTGARRGELCALRWSDYDRAGERLHIRRSLTVTKTRWTEGTTKGRRARAALLGPGLVAVLEWRRRAQLKYAAEVGVELVPDAFILSRDADGAKPCLPDGLTLAFARTCKRLGLPWHFHDLRHLAASLGLRLADAVTVAARLGHADRSMTLNVYGHEDETAARQLADDLEGVLAPALGLPIAEVVTRA